MQQQVLAQAGFPFPDLLSSLSELETKEGPKQQGGEGSGLELTTWLGMTGAGVSSQLLQGLREVGLKFKASLNNLIQRQQTSRGLGVSFVVVTV